jgi:hypothetical protein
VVLVLGYGDGPVDDIGLLEEEDHELSGWASFEPSAVSKSSLCIRHSQAFGATMFIFRGFGQHLHRPGGLPTTCTIYWT